MQTKVRTAAITDEFAVGLEEAAQAMADIGMKGAELRVVFGKNILDLTDEEVERAKRILEDKGLEIISLSSPLLKCVLPDAPAVDSRFQQDIFGAKWGFEDQAHLARRAFDLAHRTGARIVRVFSYWRVVEPEKVFDRVVEALGRLAEEASREGVTIGLENEHACNIATGAEASRVLRAIAHPNLKIVWDPANAYISGETPYPDGYRKLAPDRIVHVHIKDCYVHDHKPLWGPVGVCGIDWKGQIAALIADGYRGWISLETHWPGPQNNKFQASVICAWNLQGLVAADA
jgi:sugar phosphate isomerase/epimerase